MTVSAKQKQVGRERRHRRVRKTVRGTPERPRLAVHRSNKHITAQVIDDAAGRTLAAASTVEADLRGGPSGNKQAATQMGIEEARKNLFDVPLAGSTITHPILGRRGAGRVLLRPAAPGTGVIAGGAARAILEAAGIHDVLAKSLGSSNAINVAHATIQGLRSLKRPDEVAKMRGKSPEEVTPAGLLRAYRETKRGPHVPVEVA